jgi:hypothetical protein
MNTFLNLSDMVASGVGVVNRPVQAQLVFIQ